MKFQKTNYTCGAAAVVNALRVFGKKVSETKVRQFSSSTKELGTDEDGIKEAISALSFSYNAYESTSRTEAINWLTGAISNAQPVILCVDNYSHWVVVIGRVGDYFVLVDSSNTKANKSENGIHAVSARQLTSRWKPVDKIFYGIAVKKKQ